MIFEQWWEANHQHDFTWDSRFKVLAKEVYQASARKVVEWVEENSLSETSSPDDTGALIKIIDNLEWQSFKQSIKEAG